MLLDKRCARGCDFSPHRFFCCCYGTKGGNNSHCNGKTGNLLKIPHITNSLVSFYTAQSIKMFCPNTVCTPKFFTAEFVDHSRGVPAEKNSIPSGIPQLPDPFPRYSRNIQTHTRGTVSSRFIGSDRRLLTSSPCSHTVCLQSEHEPY